MPKLSDLWAFLQMVTGCSPTSLSCQPASPTVSWFDLTMLLARWCIFISLACSLYRYWLDWLVLALDTILLPTSLDLSGGLKSGFVWHCGLLVVRVATNCTGQFYVTARCDRMVTSQMSPIQFSTASVCSEILHYFLYTIVYKSLLCPMCHFPTKFYVTFFLLYKQDGYIIILVKWFYLVHLICLLLRISVELVVYVLRAAQIWWPT